MRIMICGSMTFSNEMMRAKRELEAMGHSAEVPCDTDLHLKDPEFIDNLNANYEHCIRNGIMKKSFDQVAESDAILILNHTKNGIEGYVGTSSLMEIGLAHYLGKRIFILNSLPPESENRWVHEVRIAKPAILNGDLGRIPNEA